MLENSKKIEQIGALLTPLDTGQELRVHKTSWTPYVGLIYVLFPGWGYLLKFLGCLLN